MDELIRKVQQLRDFQASKADTSSGQRVKLAEAVAVLDTVLNALKSTDNSEVVALQALLAGDAPEGYLTMNEANDIICFASSSKSKNRAHVEINQGRLKMTIMYGIRLVSFDELDEWLQARGYEPLEMYLKEDIYE